MENVFSRWENRAFPHLNTLELSQYLDILHDRKHIRATFHASMLYLTLEINRIWIEFRVLGCNHDCELIGIPVVL